MPGYLQPTTLPSHSPASLRHKPPAVLRRCAGVRQRVSGKRVRKDPVLPGLCLPLFSDGNLHNRPAGDRSPGNPLQEKGERSEKSPHACVHPERRGCGPPPAPAGPRSLNNILQDKKPRGKYRRASLSAPAQRVIHCSLCMDAGRVKDRNVHIALVDEQRDLRTAEDYALCPFLVHEAVNDPDVLFPRFVPDIVPDKFVEDNRVYIIPLCEVWRHDPDTILLLKRIAVEGLFHRIFGAEQRHFCKAAHVDLRTGHIVDPEHWQTC